MCGLHVLSLEFISEYIRRLSTSLCMKQSNPLMKHNTTSGDKALPNEGRSEQSLNNVFLSPASNLADDLLRSSIPILS